MSKDLSYRNECPRFPALAVPERTAVSAKIVFHIFSSNVRTKKLTNSSGSASFLSDNEMRILMTEKKGDKVA